MRITAEAAGTIDAEGRYTAAAPGTTVTATFGVSTVGGEWRISTLPKGFGRWIASTEVSRLVQPYAVHYVSTSRRALVPDVRWFPTDKLATRLARAQLVPCPTHLAGAATTAVPAGARLLGDAVSVEAGVATVNLISGRVGPGGEPAEPLGAVREDAEPGPAVTRVALSVNGVPVDLDGLDGSAGTLAEVGFRETPPAALANPVVRRGDDVVVFDPAGLGNRNPASPPAPAPTRRSPGATAASRSRPTGRSWPAWTPAATASPGGRGRTATRCRSTASTWATRPTHRGGFLWMGARPGRRRGQLWVVDTGANPADPVTAAARPSGEWLREVLESRLAHRMRPGGRRLLGRKRVRHAVDLAGVVAPEAPLPQAWRSRCGSARRCRRRAWPGWTT